MGVKKPAEKRALHATGACGSKSICSSVDKPDRTGLHGTGQASPNQSGDEVPAEKQGNDEADQTCRIDCGVVEQFVFHFQQHLFSSVSPFKNGGGGRLVDGSDPFSGCAFGKPDDAIQGLCLW